MSETHVVRFNVETEELSASRRKMLFTDLEEAIHLHCADMEGVLCVGELFHSKLIKRKRKLGRRDA